MKHFKVGYNQIEQELEYLPDLIKADTPRKAIEYAKYYLETSEGKTKEEINKLGFVAMVQGANLDKWLRKIIDRIIFLATQKNLNIMFDNNGSAECKSEAAAMNIILGEYSTLLKRLCYRLEFDIDFNDTTYKSFSITDMKTGELVFECDEL